MSPSEITQMLNLGIEHYQAGRLAEAEAAYRRVLASDPSNAHALHLLGTLALHVERADFAVELIAQAVRINPNVPDFHVNFGEALRRVGRVTEAVHVLEGAVRAAPTFAGGHYNLGCAWFDALEFSRAAGEFELAIALDPPYLKARTNLGNCLLRLGKVEGAIDCYLAAAKEAMPAPDGQAAMIESNVLCAYHYRSQYSPEFIFQAHVEWAARHADPLSRHQRPHTNDRSPDRQLVIGYVSPNFSLHAAASFIEPVLRKHDNGNFRIICYSNLLETDALTNRFRGYADAWRDIVMMTDEQVAGQIQRDGVDILVDLNGHAAGHRLGIFALRPAPVQVTWLGYMNTTGMSAIDYRITDALADPPGMTERLHVEKLVRLPEAFYCFHPPEDAPDVSPLPAQTAGYITFGCLNNIAKASPEAIAAWAKILHSVPLSSLQLALPGKASDPGYAHILESFAALGITESRLQLIDRQGRREYLAQYNQIDIALDPFPCVGHTTTCDALWMGVPTLTLAGRAYVQRMGVSVMTNMGMSDWVADSVEAYVRRAVAAAGAIEELSRRCVSLRERMRASTITDGAGFTRKLEEAYKKMWESRL